MYEVAKNNGKPINNLFGYMRKGIIEKWETSKIAKKFSGECSKKIPEDGYKVTIGEWGF